ncbi:MAG: hypothetical protein K2X82_14570 [Gemmataceae bacterium]|nr:hypothetical protein [Gemmataceae bacterium]
MDIRVGRWLPAVGAVVLVGVVGPAARADPPAGWGGGGKGYELAVDKDVKHAGKASGTVKAVDAEEGGFGTLTQAFAADNYKGKRVRMTAHVKTKDVDGWAGLWLRADGAEKINLAFDNMMDRPVKGTTDWKKYEVVLDIPDDAGAIFFGFLVSGAGQGWVDGFKFEVVGKDVKTTGPEIEPADRPDGTTLPKDLPKDPANLDFED